MAAALRGESNPFDVRPGAVPPAFGGRERELAALETARVRIEAGRPGPIMVIEAHRGYGKTALLAHAVHASADTTSPIVAIKRDIAVGPGSLAGALTAAVTAIAQGTGLDRITGVRVGPVEVTRQPDDRSEGDVDLADLTARLAQAAADSDRAVVLAIDEAHEHPEVAIAVLRGLQWVDRAPVACYFAGLPGTRDGFAEVITWAERIPVTSLSLLSRDEVGDALVVPFGDYGIEVDTDVIDAVAAASGGYPYFVALWGHHLWAHAPTDVIDADAVAAATGPVRNTVGSLYQGRWARITPTQRHYAQALAELGGSAGSADVAATMDRTISSVSPLRAELIKRGMIHAPSRGQIAFTIPGLADWITQTQSV